jgi:hypothetical protein
MWLNVICVAMTATTVVVSGLELPPTDQTSFSYPSNGAGIALPFPSQIASLTGLSAWPALWVSPPFTPNMAARFNPAATAVNPDVVAPPNANGLLPFHHGPPLIAC